MSTINTFHDFGFYNWIPRQCEKFGIKKPTPIQKHCIPQILNGLDCIGAAKTGSGKTLAFALPIMQKLCEETYGIFALILTPVRELAFQIGEQFEVMGKPMNLKKCIVVGGMNMVDQGLALSKHPHIVIATPGRLADHLEGCDTFSLKKIKFLVLDEADRLLGGQFDKQIEIIFKALPKEKQMLLFSATITPTLEIVKKTVRKDAFLWQDKDEVATVETLDQYYLLCPVDARDSYLVQAVRVYREKHPKDSIMIFVHTCKSCQVLSMMFNSVGFNNVALHGMMSQKERLTSLNRFRSRRIYILISTDVSARGLDIPGVGLVVNHIPPTDPNEYVHRVGRTARAGRTGASITIVAPSDLLRLQAIEERIGYKLKEFEGVKDSEVSKILLQVSVSKREAEISLDVNDFYEKKRINKRKQLIMEGKDPDEEEEKLELEKKKRRKEWKKNKKKLKNEIEQKKMDKNEEIKEMNSECE